MSKEKEQVLEYLQTDRTLLGGRNLYNKLPNKSLALQNSFARMTNTPANVARLQYQLAKTVGIAERQLNILLQQPLKKSLDKVEIDAPQPTDLTPEEKLLAFNSDTADFFGAKELAKELGVKPKGRKKEDLFDSLAIHRNALINAQVKALPVEVKASIKLREQFPFLREATCPDSLKLLVNDLITSYETFKEAQPKLHDLLDADAAKAAVDVVLENYFNNKEAWNELEHYKSTGQILGEHPLFERLEAKEAISALNTVDLTDKIKNLGINIGKNKKKGNDDLVARDEDLLAHAKAVLEKR